MREYNLEYTLLAVAVAAGLGLLAQPAAAAEPNPLNLLPRVQEFIPPPAPAIVEQNGQPQPADQKRKRKKKSDDSPATKKD